MRNSSPWLFFALTFLWSWLFWVPTAFWAPDATSWMTRLGFGLGGLGPMVFGIFLTRREGTGKEWRDYWRRVWDGRRLRFWDWTLTLAAIPLLTLFAGWVDMLLGGKGITWDGTAPGYFTGLFPQPVAFFSFLVFIFLFGPLPEELGWRGYALDRLRIRQGSLGASLVLGLIWGLWHLPLFFLKGAYQSSLGFGMAGFFLFFAAILPLSVVMTWIYDLTDRSILSAILVHFSVNLSGTVMAHGTRVELFRVLICWAWALGTIFLPKKGTGVRGRAKAFRRANGNKP